MKRRQHDLPVLAFALTLIVLVGGALLGYLNARRLIANDRSVSHTDEAIVELITVLSRLQDTEARQRAYLLTDNDSDLQPYEDATARIQSEVARLQRLIVDPAQQARLAELQHTIALKQLELERTIALSKSGNRAAALALVRSNAGKVLMEEARTQVAAMRAAEYGLLNRRAAESESSSRTTIISIVFAALIGCALLALVFSLTRRNLLLRQRAMDALSAERERLRVTLASIGDAVLTADSSCRITFMNPTAEALTGWTQLEMLGQPLDAVYRIVNEHTRAILENPAERALRDGFIVGLSDHTVLIRKDGTERPIDDSAAPIVDAHGNLLGCVLVFRDITQRRQAEQRRADDEARIRSVLDHTVDGILTIDEAGTIETFNPASERLFGCKAEDVVGRNVKLLVPEPFNHQHDSYIDNYHSTGNAAILGIAREVEGRRQDGTSLPLELAVSEFALGARRHFTAIVRDITHRRRIEQQMHDMMTELKQTDRRKDEFLAMLAHELRGPLAPLRNGLQLLKRPDITPEQVRQIRAAMERQLNQMVRLVNDLIDANRITRNKLDLRSELVDLAAVIQQSIETCQPLADAARHQISVALPSRPRYLNADPARLTQVFANILHNACKYTEPGGRIWISVQLTDDEVSVHFKDTGVGIPANKLGSIFELFTQVDRTPERSQGGLGIGLSLVKRLVEMHGGSVKAFSEGPGRGSEFVVRLPVCNQAPGVQTVQAVVELDLPSRRVLIVDDNADSATSLAMLLQASGQETHTAHDGLEALTAAERLQPDMILLDIGLPQLNGYEVCRRVRQQQWARSILIVAVSGWGQNEDRRKSKEAGFDAHMVKPPDYPALMQLFSDHLSVRTQAAPGNA